MIIKIEGLPQGQKIKHINVDIQFEDDVPVVKSTVDTTASTKPDARQDTLSTEDLHEIVKDHPPVEDSHREKKEIPKEMTDMEF